MLWGPGPNRLTGGYLLIIIPNHFLNSVVDIIIIRCRLCAAQPATGALCFHLAIPLFVRPVVCPSHANIGSPAALAVGQ